MNKPITAPFHENISIQYNAALAITSERRETLPEKMDQQSSFELSKCRH